jgi:tRNA G18 (ribose-2'-O)-methylase SpoU
MKNRKLHTIEMNRISVEEFREAEKMPLIVVLDDVRSMYNIGSVFRTCDAFRVEAIYLCGITACPPHQEIHKTALGAEDSVRWRYFKTAQEAVEQLHQDGYFVWSVEQCEGSVKAPTPLQLSRDRVQGASPQGGMEGVAVILGNEVKGVHQEVIDMSDGCLEIPQFGTKHSMNVSVTAGIVIWEFARQYMF